MTKAFVLVHSNSLDAVTSALRVPTGNMVTTQERNHDPATNTWGPPYDVQVPEFTGGYATIGRLGQWNALLVQSTTANLQAINAAVLATDLILLCLVTEAGTVRWSELDNPIGTVLRTRLNTWLTANGKPTIPAGTPLRQVVRAAFRYFGDRFELDGSTDLGAS